MVMEMHLLSKEQALSGNCTAVEREVVFCSNSKASQSAPKTVNAVAPKDSTSQKEPVHRFTLSWERPTCNCSRGGYSGFGCWHQADHLHPVKLTLSTPRIMYYSKDTRLPMATKSSTVHHLTVVPCTHLRSHTVKWDHCSNWKSSFPGRVETKAQNSLNQLCCWGKLLCNCTLGARSPNCSTDSLSTANHYKRWGFLFQIQSTTPWPHLHQQACGMAFRKPVSDVSLQQRKKTSTVIHDTA